jgi:hypothetical protein
MGLTDKSIRLHARELFIPALLQQVGKFGFLGE